MKIIYFVSVDWFFFSHFLSRATAAQNLGYEINILTSKGEKSFLFKKNKMRLIPLKICRKTLNPFKLLIYFIRVLHIFCKEKPDIIHLISLKPIFIGIIAAHFSGCRSIINSITGAGTLFVSSEKRILFYRLLAKNCFRLFFNSKKSFNIFENNDDRKLFLKYSLTNKKNSFIIKGAGVDCAKFFLDPGRPKKQLIILAARILWDKGIGEFVEAAKILKPVYQLTRFVIIGKPDFENRACIDSYTLSKWRAEGFVELWGFRRDLPKILSYSTIACLPSYREGLPKFLIEAMAASLPCVTTDVPGCRDAVRNGDNGILVPPKNGRALAEAIEYLIKNPNIRKKMGQRGRYRAITEFSQSVINRQTLSIYKKCKKAY